MTLPRTLLLLLACLLPALFAARCSSAAARARIQQNRLYSILAHTQTLARLTPHLPAPSHSAVPTDLLASIHTALRQAALPDSALATFSPLAPLSPTSDPSSLSIIHQYSFHLTLAPLTLPQFGAFLGKWHHSQPGWLITSLQLQPLSTPPATSHSAPTPCPLHFTLIIEPHAPHTSPPEVSP